MDLYAYEISCRIGCEFHEFTLNNKATTKHLKQSSNLDAVTIEADSSMTIHGQCCDHIKSAHCTCHLNVCNVCMSDVCKSVGKAWGCMFTVCRLEQWRIQRGAMAPLAPPTSPCPVGRKLLPPPTRCQILRPKCTKFDFGWGSAPDPAYRSVFSERELKFMFAISAVRLSSVCRLSVVCRL